MKYSFLLIAAFLFAAIIPTHASNDSTANVRLSITPRNPETYRWIIIRNQSDTIRFGKSTSKVPYGWLLQTNDVPFIGSRAELLKQIPDDTIKQPESDKIIVIPWSMTNINGVALLYPCTSYFIFVQHPDGHWEWADNSIEQPTSVEYHSDEKYVWIVTKTAKGSETNWRNVVKDSEHRFKKWISWGNVKWDY